MPDKMYAGTKSSPAAGDVIVQSDALPRGRYLVFASSYVHGGSPAAIEEENVGLYSDTTLIGPVLLIPAADDAVETPPLTVSVDDQKKISVKATADGTSGVTYLVHIVVRPEAQW